MTENKKHFCGNCLHYCNTLNRCKNLLSFNYCKELRPNIIGCSKYTSKNKRKK